MVATVVSLRQPTRFGRSTVCMLTLDVHSDRKQCGMHSVARINGPIEDSVSRGIARKKRHPDLRLGQVAVGMPKDVRSILSAGNVERYREYHYQAFIRLNEDHVSTRFWSTV
jgi:hypothetical protein